MEEITLKKILEKAKRKKISYDVNEKTLEMIDEMAGILEISRSKMMDALLISGILAHTNLAIEEWESMKNQEDKNEKKRISEVVDKIKRFKKKWDIPLLRNQKIKK